MVVIVTVSDSLAQVLLVLALILIPTYFVLYLYLHPQILSTEMCKFFRRVYNFIAYNIQHHDHNTHNIIYPPYSSYT